MSDAGDEAWRQVREVAEKYPDYASYGRWPPDKQVAEMDHARALLAYLAQRHGRSRDRYPAPWRR